MALDINRVNELKTNIMKIIKDDTYDMEDLKNIIDPAGQYVDNPIFLSYVSEIVKVILEDRDGNDTFTIDDLDLLSRDVMGVTALINSILLVLATLPNVNLKYNEGATEDLILRVFAYVFLVVVPNKRGVTWTVEEKERVLDLIILIHQLIISSQVTKDLVKNVVAWFKKKGWCKCGGTVNKEEVFTSHAPQVKTVLMSSIQNNREKLVMQKEIKELKSIQPTDNEDLAKSICELKKELDLVKRIA